MGSSPKAPEQPSKQQLEEQAPPTMRDESVQAAGSTARSRARRRAGTFQSILTGEGGFERSSTLG